MIFLFLLTYCPNEKALNLFKFNSEDVTSALKKEEKKEEAEK